MFESQDAWYWHNSLWMKWTLAYRPELDSKLLSFYVDDDTGHIAACPLMLEKSSFGQDRVDFSYGGGFLPCPVFRNDLGDKRRAQIEKLVYQHLNELAAEFQVNRALFRGDSVTVDFFRASPPPINPLIKFGFLDCSHPTMVIDLTQPLDTLKNQMRKGHRYDVNRAGKVYEVNIYHRETATEVIFEEYRDMHFRTSGRATRSKATFDLMRDMAAAGDGVLFGAEAEGMNRYFILLVLYKGSAYYASATDDPAYTPPAPGHHLLQWAAINWLKERGFQMYELGIQYFGAQLYSIPSPKMIDISLYTRGFGGHLVPSHRAEKYYNREMLKRAVLERLEKICFEAGQ